MKILFKKCPNCRGDLYLDQDFLGCYWECLQCARMFEIKMKQSLMNASMVTSSPGERAAQAVSRRG